MTADDATIPDESADQPSGFTAAYAIRDRMHTLATRGTDPAPVAAAFVELSALIAAARDRAGTVLGDALRAYSLSLRAYLMTAHADDESEARVRAALNAISAEPPMSLRESAWDDAIESIRVNRGLLGLGRAETRENLGQVLNTLASLQAEHHPADPTRLEAVDAFATSCFEDLHVDWRFAIRLAAKLVMAHARYVGLSSLAPTQSAGGAHALNRAQHWLERAMRLIAATEDDPHGDTLHLLLEAVTDSVLAVANAYESALTTDIADPDWAQLAFWSALEAVIMAGNAALDNTERLNRIVGFESAGSSMDGVVATIRRRMLRAIVLAHDAVYRTHGPALASIAKLNLRAHLHAIAPVLWPRDHDYREILDNVVAAVASWDGDDAVDPDRATLDEFLDMLEFRFTTECYEAALTSFADDDETSPDGDVDESGTSAFDIIYALALLTGRTVPPIAVDYLMAVLTYGNDHFDGRTEQVRDELRQIRNLHPAEQLSTLAADPSAGAPEWIQAVAAIIRPLMGEATDEGDDNFHDAARRLASLEADARKRRRVTSGVLQVLTLVAEEENLTDAGRISWNTAYSTFLEIAYRQDEATSADLWLAAKIAQDTIARASSRAANRRESDLLRALHHEAIATAHLESLPGGRVPEGGRSLAEIATQVDELIAATTSPVDGFTDIAEQARNHIAYLRGPEGHDAADRLPHARAADLPVRYLSENPDPNAEGYNAAVLSIKVRVGRRDWHKQLATVDLAVLLGAPNTAVTPLDCLAIVERAYRATAHDEPEAVVAMVRLALPLNVHKHDPVLGRRIEYLLETIADHYYSTVFATASVAQDVLTFYLYRASAGLNFGATSREELEHRYLLSLIIHVAACAQGLVDEMTLASYHCSEFARELRLWEPAITWARITRNLLQQTNALTATQHLQQRHGIELDVARTLRPFDEE